MDTLTREVLLFLLERELWRVQGLLLHGSRDDEEQWSKLLDIAARASGLMKRVSVVPHATN